MHHFDTDDICLLLIMSSLVIDMILTTQCDNIDGKGPHWPKEYSSFELQFISTMFHSDSEAI